MEISNVTAHITANADQLNGYVRSAQDAFKNYKSTAMVSAANCYLVWFFAASEQAESFARTWFVKKVEERNAAIDIHNDKLHELKSRVKAYVDGTTGEIAADEYAELKDYLSYTDDDWSKADKLKVEAREGASQFTLAVKFVFEFDSVSDASNVSRYAKVLEYIHQRHAQLHAINEEAIVELLKKAGGFEAALDIARGNNNENSGSASENGGSEGEEKRDAKVLAIKTAIGHATPVDSITYDPKFTRDGYVFMIGRKVDDKVAVYGELDVSVNEAKSLVLKVDTDVLGGLDPFAEFVAKICEIGTMVRDGKKSLYTVDGTSSGEKLKVARAYALCEDDSGKYVQVSARYTAASAVIVARPKPEIDIGTLKAGQFLMLPTERDANDTATKTGKDLAKQLGSIGDRIMYGMAAISGTDNAPVIWQVVPHGKTTGQDSNDPQFCWTRVAKEKHKPVCVDSFDAKFAARLPKTAVQDVHENYTSKWKKAKKDEDKTFIPITLTYDGLALTFEHDKHKAYAVPVGSVEQPNVTLAMRPRDIADLFTLLAEQNTDSFEVKADPKGLLLVSWSDKYGEYEIYLPTVDDKGQLKDRCLSELAPLL